MNVLHISNYFDPHIGGIEQTAKDVMNVLKKLENIKQELICFNTLNKNVVDNIDGNKIIRCSTFAKIASQSISLSFNKILQKEIKLFKPDVIIFHFPNPLQSTALMKQLAKHKNIKLIVYYHLDITKQKILGKLFEKQTFKLLERAKTIIATSPNYVDGSKFLKKFKNKCAIIPSMIDIERLKLTEEEKLKAIKINKKYENKKIIFFIGRHVEYKGLEYLIEADKYLNQNNTQIIIAGNGKLTNVLKNKASNIKNIEFIGKISDSDYRCYLKAAYIFAFPSITKNEAFGLSLAEAMYLYKPSVTFKIDGSGVNYLNLNNVTGFEAKNQDSKDYADKINLLLNDSSLYKRFSSNSHNRIENLCMKEQFEFNIKEAIEKVK